MLCVEISIYGNHLMFFGENFSCWILLFISLFWIEKNSLKIEYNRQRKVPRDITSVFCTRYRKP